MKRKTLYRLTALLLTLVLVRRTRAPAVFGLMTHLETPLTTSIVALTTMVSVTFVAPWVNSSISFLPMTTRKLLFGALVVIYLLLLRQRLDQN